MKALITARLLGTLKPADRPYEVRDAKLKGFILRVQPTGVKSYIAQYSRGRRITLGQDPTMTPQQARDKALIVLADAAQGTDPQAARRLAKVTNFGSYLSHEYGPWVETHRKDGKATMARLKACFAEEFGNKKLTDINPWIVEKWRAARLKGGIMVATINRDLVALKAALAKAVEWKLIDAHPLQGVKLGKVDSAPKTRFLDDDEEERLRKALDEREERIRAGRDSANQWRRVRGYETLPDLRTVTFADLLKPLILTALNTGMRRGELFGLTWADVDLERRILTVLADNAKAGKTRHIPLNSEVLATLTDWRKQAADTNGRVFPARDGGRLDNIKTAWTGLLKKADISHFRFHDLRHSFASRLVMAGVDLAVVRELMGHGDIQMTLRYSHLAPEHKAAAVERLTQRTATSKLSLSYARR